MNSALGFLFASVAFLFAVLYATDTFEPRPKGPLVFEDLKLKTDDYAHIYLDRETGCQYIRVRFGVTPRLGPDGKPLCNAPKK